MYGNPFVSTSPSVLSALPVHHIALIVPCYKRVFVTECHNRYSASRDKAAYTRGMQWVSKVGRRGNEGREEGGKGAERVILMSREGVAVLSS